LIEAINDDKGPEESRSEYIRRAIRRELRSNDLSDHLSDIEKRLSEIEKDVSDHGDRLDDHDGRLTAIENRSLRDLL